MVASPSGVELWRSDGARVAGGAAPPFGGSTFLVEDLVTETPGTDARQGLLRPAVRRHEAGRKDTGDTVTPA